MGLFTQFKNHLYDNDDYLPHLHFYLFVNNEEFTDSMRRVLTSKLNGIFNASFSDPEIKDILDTDDFESIFIVKDDPTRKLLQCTIKLSKKLTNCAQPLFDQIFPTSAPVPIEEEQKEEAPVLKSNKSSTKKSKKEIVKKPSQTSNDLEEDAQDGVSSRLLNNNNYDRMDLEGHQEKRQRLSNLQILNTFQLRVKENLQAKFSDFFPFWKKRSKIFI